jgi:hypothetical protein
MDDLGQSYLNQNTYSQNAESVKQDDSNATDIPDCSMNNSYEYLCIIFIFEVCCPDGVLISKELKQLQTYQICYDGFDRDIVLL